jgi:hypothetical protein
VSDGWCLTRRLGRRSSNLLASLLANCWVESRATCELASVADWQASHNLFFVPGSGLSLNFLFSGIWYFLRYYRPKWLCFWPASGAVRLPGRPLSGSRLAACLASGPARRPGGCSLACPKNTWRPGGAAVQLPGRPAGRPKDQLAAGWLPGLTGPCNMGLHSLTFCFWGGHFCFMLFPSSTNRTLLLYIYICMHSLIRACQRTELRTD